MGEILDWLASFDDRLNWLTRLYYRDDNCQAIIRLFD